MKNFKFKWLLLSFILSIASINTAWADTRLFTTGQKVFFQDAKLSTLGNVCWKSGEGGNVYAHFFNKKRDSGEDETVWAEARLVYGSDGTAGAIYEFTVPELNGASASWWGVLFTRGTGTGWGSTTWNQTTDQWPALEKSLFTISNTKDNDKWTGNWTVMPEMRCSMTNPTWSAEDGWFFTGYSGEKGIIKITCTADQKISFKIYDGTWYGHWTYGNSFSELSDYGPKTEGGGDNFNFKADEAGEYIFQWDKTNHKLWVWEPKARLTKQKYVYFDARNLTGSNSDYWQRGNFTARFYFKYYDSGDNEEYVDCTKANALEDWVYYALVPDNDYIGQIQMNRLPVSDEATCAANVAYAKDRDNTSVNCLTGSTDWCSSWDPSWTTYCPPTKSETFADNSTTKIAWQDGGNDGSTSGKAILVKTGTSIKAMASATKSVADGDMTINYDFKVNGTSQQAGTSNTFSYAASTNNTAYNVTMDAYTVYNLDGTSNSTKHTHATTLYYKALDTYSVTNTLTNISSNGRSGSDAAAYNIAYTATLSVGTGYTLPATITVKRGETTLTASTQYTYNSTTGALSINAAQVTGNLTIIAAGVAKTYTETDNLDKNGGDAHGKYTATYDATKIEINTTPTKANYHVEGYYLEADCTNKIADAAGTLVSNVTKDAVNYTDGTGKWKKDASVKLYTKWEENSFTVTVNAGTHGTVSTTSVTGHPITASSNFTITANAGYAFSHWTFSEEDKVTANYVSTGGTNNATQTFNIKATKAITMTANYVVRYGLYGSLDTGESGNEAGMPGWGVSADFSYSAGTYTISRTLTKPNTNYKFRIQDRRNNFSYGCSSNYTFIKNNEATTLNSGSYNAYIATAGKGSYTLTVTEVNEGAYPAVSISSHPESYLVTLGVKSVRTDGSDAGELGGTITATDAAGNTYTSGQYIANGETVTVEATDIPTGYHFVGWWSSSAYSDDAFATVNPTYWTVNEPVNAYVKFTEDTKETASGDGDWSAKVDDSKITDVVTISSTITVDVDHAKAKRVILDQSGDGKAGKLVVTANKGLEVAEGIWINNGTSLVAPTAEDLVLESSASGNATLIFNNSNSAAATVQMYSKASAPEGETWRWQYAAAPAAVSALYNYYGGYLYKWNNGWQVVHGSDNTELFAGYCVSYPTSGHTFAIEGALALTDATNQVLTIPAGKEWVVGNSWTAPIQIKQMTAEDFSNVTQTIYLFNTGMDNADEGVIAGDKGNSAAGSYVTIPIAEAGTGSLPAVISSLQGFYVKNETGSAGTLTLNYGKHVRPSGGNSIQNGAMHAPKRLQTDDKQVMTITAHGSRFTSRLVLFAHEDYTFGYDAGHDGENINSPGVGPLIYTLREDGTHDDVSAVPEYEGALVGFEAGEDSEYTFKFTYDGDGVWYLNDTKTGLSTLIKNNNTYKFDVSSDDAARFIISATPYNAPAVTTGLNEVESGFARKQMINGVLYVIRDGRIYNAEGAVVK